MVFQLKDSDPDDQYKVIPGSNSVVFLGLERKLPPENQPLEVVRDQGDRGLPQQQGPGSGQPGGGTSLKPPPGPTWPAARASTRFARRGTSSRKPSLLLVLTQSPSPKSRTRVNSRTGPPRLRNARRPDVAGRTDRHRQSPPLSQGADPRGGGRRAA